MRNLDLKWCKMHKEFIRRIFFGLDKRTKDGLRDNCRDCSNTYEKERRKKALNKECRDKRGRIHGMSKTPEYHAWGSAKSRCHNLEDSSYGWYGARGITMCDEWRDDFLAFYLWIGPRPEGRSLDRIDNDGNYEPGNVRWATDSQQRASQRRQPSEDWVHRRRTVKRHLSFIDTEGE